MDLHHLKRSVPASVTGLLLCALSMSHGPASAADGAVANAIPMKLWTAVDTPLNRAYVQQFEEVLKEESGHTISVELVSRDKTSSVAEALHSLANKEADLYMMPWAVVNSFNNARATWKPVNLVGNSKVPQITVSAASFPPHDDLTFYVISQYLNGLTTYVMKTPVHSIDDLKGKKIRLVGGSPIYYRLLRKFGAIPIPSQFGDERPPGTTSVIDGAHIRMVPSLAKDWYKSTPNLVISPNAYTATLGMLSGVWFSNLPANTKNAVVTAGAKMTDWAKATTLRSNKSLTQEWLKKGGAVQFIPLLSDKNKVAWTKGYSIALDKTIDEMSAALKGSTMKLKF